MEDRAAPASGVTGAYDPETNRPVFRHRQSRPRLPRRASREGDNSIAAHSTARRRYRQAEVALPVHAATTHDYDATEVPILGDLTVNGQQRKAVLFANRNGFYYTLDRTNGRVIVAKPFVQRPGQSRSTRRAAPYSNPGAHRMRRVRRPAPDLTGGTNFWPPSFDPRTQMFFVNAREACATFYAYKPEYVPGQRFHRWRATGRQHAHGSPLWRYPGNRSRDR